MASERYEPWNRLIDDHPLLAEIRELKMMSPADLTHYAATPGGVCMRPVRGGPR